MSSTKSSSSTLERLKRLEYRQRWLLRLQGPQTRLARFVLDYELDADQLRGLEDVMEAAHQTLSRGGQLAALDFEKQLSPYIPPQEQRYGIAYDFVKAMLMALYQWNIVIDHFRRDYNVPLYRH